MYNSHVVNFKHLKYKVRSSKFNLANSNPNRKKGIVKMTNSDRLNDKTVMLDDLVYFDFVHIIFVFSVGF